jgi:radical SAM protein with 4Fe4S-binding SPASM domain
MNRPSLMIRKALNRLALHLGSRRAFAMPFQILVETTNRCNLRCPLCPVGDGRMSRKRENMDLALYRQVIDQVAPFEPTVTLCNFGETFLYPQLIEACRYAKEKGLRVETTTNSQCLDKGEEYFRELIATGIDYIKVALDGVDQESLAKYRKGGSFEKAVRGIRALVEARDRLGSRTPFIPLQFVLMKHNEYQVDQVREIGEQLGVDEVVVKKLYIDIELENAVELADEYLCQSEFDRIKVDEQGGLQLAVEYTNKCPLIYNTAVILVNGDVVACCHDYNGEFTMGNVREQPFREIWNGSNYRNLRQEIRSNRSAYQICRTCTVGTKPGNYRKA